MILFVNKGEGAASRVYDDILNRANSIKTEDMTYRQAVVSSVGSYMKDNGIAKGNMPEAFVTARALAVEKAIQVDAYKDDIREKINNATRLLSTDFMSDNSTEKYLLLKSRFDLNKLKDVSPSLSNGIWLEKLFEYNCIQIFVLALICYVVYSFFYDKKSSLKLIVNSGKKGRKVLRAKRIFILIAESIAISFCFYVESAIILISMFGGVSGINDLAVLDNNMLLTTMDLTRGAFLLLLIVISAFFAFACGMAFWLT